MFSNLLLSLIGYDVEKLSQPKPNDQVEPVEVVTKKQRTSSDGTQEDWEYLLNSKLHETIGNSLATMLNLNQISTEGKKARPFKPTQESEKQAQFNINGLLFPFTIQVLYSFHLVYEEIKLNTLLWSDLKPLATFLYQIAKDLKLDGYVNHYWLDFPADVDLEVDESESQMSDAVLKKLSEPSYFSKDPPHVFSYINSMLKEVDVGYYPYLVEVNNMSKDLIEVSNLFLFVLILGLNTLFSLIKKNTT